MRRAWIAIVAALALTSATAGLADAQPPASSTAAAPAVMLVVDTSGSMAGSRLDQAKAALTHSVDALAAGQVAGLRSYAGNCGDGGLLRTPLGADNRADLRTQIAALIADGGTPTPDALTAAAADLAGTHGPRQIILISDGQSTCGDPCPVAKALAQQQGIDFKVHTVGYNAPDSAEGELACVARETGGQYFSVDDGPGLAGVIGQLIGGGGAGAGPQYVAVGDSITTGGAIPKCKANRDLSPWGCTTNTATPYPDRVAATLGYSLSDDIAVYTAAAPQPPNLGLDRVGIWGYTVQEAATDAKNRKNANGPWQPQLTAASGARQLVTGALGINDLRFSDVQKWLKLFGSSVRSDRVTDEAQKIMRDRSADFDAFFTALDAAKAKGAKVVVTLYYNPYDTFNDRCLVLKTISTRLLTVLDSELETRAHAHGFLVADFRPSFQAHGAGSADPFVFGTQCKAASAVADWAPKWLGGGGGQSVVQEKFDPHPNDKGTQAMADAILKVAR